MRVYTNTAEIQAKAHWLCIHIGTIAVLFGRAKYAHRIEICTPNRWFRFSKGTP